MAASDGAPAQDSGLQVALLESSFAKVKPKAGEFADSFYENLFTDYPAAKPLFANTDVKEQSKKLLASLVFVVENLKNPGALTDALKGLGARHVKYGALPEHYPLVGNTLLKTFGQYLEGDWTPEVEKAWTEAYGVITEVMLDGADYSSEEVALEQPAEEEGLKVGTLASDLGLTEHRLRFLINQQMGFRNFSSFLNTARIDYAKEILADPRESHRQILQIGLDVGFSSIGPFNKAFKELTGETPREFRKKHSMADGKDT